MPITTSHQPHIHRRIAKLRTDDRYILSMVLVGTTLTVLGWNFVQLGLTILNAPYFCIAFGMGISIFAFTSNIYNKIIKRNLLKSKLNQPLPNAPDKNELLSEKPPELYKRKEIHIPMLAKIRRGYGKKAQAEKNSSYFSELKSWFSITRLREKWLLKQETSKIHLNNTVSDTNHWNPEVLIIEKVEQKKNS